MKPRLTYFGVVGAEKLANSGKDSFVGARFRFSEPVLELGEDLLDGVEVRRVFGQEEKLGSSLADRMPDGFAPVTAQVASACKGERI